MARKLARLPEIGSPDAGELFALVGSALSWWEGAEDVLMGFFKWLCGATEPIAVESYIQAPRKVRESMLELAIETYAHRLSSGEIDQVRHAISRLKKLGVVRNEIAHGHVSYHKETQLFADGTSKTVAEGNYLLPSLNEGNWHERTFRFHHTAQSIVAFREEVRDHRWTIHQVHMVAMEREQDEERNAGPGTSMLHDVASDIAARRIKPREWERYMRPLSEWGIGIPPWSDQQKSLNSSRE